MNGNSSTGTCSLLLDILHQRYHQEDIIHGTDCHNGVEEEEEEEEAQHCKQKTIIDGADNEATATDGTDNEATVIKATRMTNPQWTDQEDSIIMDAVINSLEKPFTRWVDLSQ